MSIPYFETKVVKVKKADEKCEHSHLMQIQDMPYRVYQCANCGYYMYPPLKKNYLLVKGKVYKQQKRGNWVNGENLDKIKFPCFCRYVANSQRWFGEINKSWIPGEGTTYYLSSLNGQKECSIVTICHLLKELIEGYDIHILKGKIILFDEED